MIESVPCLCCDSSMRYIGHKGRFSIFNCAKCGFLTTRPLPSNQELSLLYTLEYFVKSDLSKQKVGYQNVLSEEFERGNYQTAINRIKRIETITRHKGKLLDIGCAQGIFIRAALDSGWSADGVEINSEMRAAAGKISPSTNIFSSIDEVYTIYDVITMWECLEHIIAPDRFLLDVQRKLRPDGLLCLSFPNIASRRGPKAKREWEQVKPPEHIHLWGEKSIRYLLAKHGFSAVKFKYFGLKVILEAHRIFGTRKTPKTPLWPLVSFLYKVGKPIYSTKMRSKFGEIVHRLYDGIEVYAQRDSGWSDSDDPTRAEV